MKTRSLSENRNSKPVQINLQNSLEQSPIGVAILDKNLKYIFSNKKWINYLNLSKQKIIGHSFLDYFNQIPDSDSNKINSKINLNDILSNRETKIQIQVGPSIIEITFCPSRLKSQSQSVFCISQDVSQKKSTEYELKKLKSILEITVKDRTKTLNDMNSELQIFFDQASEGIFTAKNDGKILSLNSAGCTMLGFENKEVKYKNVLDLIHHDDHKNAFKTIKKLKKNGKSNISEWKIKRKDGCYIDTEISWKIYSDKIIRGFIKDVSIRKKNEERELFLSKINFKLANTTSYLERIQITVNSVISKFADMCIYSNYENSSHNIIAYAANDQSFIDHFTNHAANTVLSEKFNKLSQSSINNLESFTLDEITLDFLIKPTIINSKTFDYANYKINSCICIPVISKEKAIGLISVFMTTSMRKFEKDDVTFFERLARRSAIAIENAKLYQETQNAVYSHELVLAIVSHDLKNPLSAIQKNAQLLARSKITNPDKQKEMYNRIVDSASAMQTLISDLLDLSKAQLGTFSLNKQVIEIRSLVKKAVGTMANKLNEKNLQLHIEVRKDIPKINADPGRLIQLLWNLIGNAIKFTPAGGVIQIKVQLETDFILFCITDSGPGISKEDIPRLFDRFWQSKKTAELGLGLGLAISKGIVEAHNGKIWAESELSNGATFYFTIPIN